MENIGTFVIYLVRSGKISNEVSIRVDTVEGTAEEGSDYRGVHGDFTMEPGQSELPIEMEISNAISLWRETDWSLSVDDDQWEPDEEFFLKISLINNEADADILKIGRKHIMTIKFAQFYQYQSV